MLVDPDASAREFEAGLMEKAENDVSDGASPEMSSDGAKGFEGR